MSNSESFQAAIRRYYDGMRDLLNENYEMIPPIVLTGAMRAIRLAELHDEHNQGPMYDLILGVANNGRVRDEIEQYCEHPATLNSREGFREVVEYIRETRPDFLPDFTIVEQAG